MKLGTRGMVGLVVAAFAVVLGACGPAGNTGTAAGAGASGAGSSGAGAGTSSSSFHCCINAEAYACPNKTDFDACAGGDPQACFTTCGNDPACIGQCMSMIGGNDPSGCTMVNEPASSYCGSTGTGSGTGSGSSGSGTGTGSGSSGAPSTCLGQACKYDADCPTGQHCDTANGYCFDVSADCVGNPCVYDVDCPDGEACDTATSTCFAK